MTFAEMCMIKTCLMAATKAGKEMFGKVCSVKAATSMSNIGIAEALVTATELQDSDCMKVRGISVEVVKKEKTGSAGAMATATELKEADCLVVRGSLAESVARR